VLLTHLCLGQQATVLQLPAHATAHAPAEARARIAHGAPGDV
jgi:hypothetical protein